ncbi:MAG: hypothetical protein K2X34_07910 [Hyphomonadaceae bacterium]|nr:hypothetical protein [Hyphomonadaceae bacterium]MBY0422757.1 hypothetical protein [Parvularculaceae bacterium]
MFLWRGAGVTNAFAVALQAAGLECEPHDVGITLPDTSPDEARVIIRQIAEANTFTAEALSGFVQGLRSALYDELVSEAILRNEWCKRNKAYCAEISALAQSLS